MVFNDANGDGKRNIFDEEIMQGGIDFVMLDINMPVMNGEEMIARMRANPESRDIPTVVVSTEGSETRIERLRGLGAEFIHKPFTPEIIRDTILALTGLGGAPHDDPA